MPNAYALAGGARADLLLFIPGVAGLSNSENIMVLPDIEGSASDSLSKTGTATASAYLTNGQTYSLRADAESFVGLQAPEPSSLALLGLGLFGIALWPRGRKRASIEGL